MFPLTLFWPTASGHPRLRSRHYYKRPPNMSQVQYRHIKRHLLQSRDTRPNKKKPGLVSLFNFVSSKNNKPNERKVHDISSSNSDITPPRSPMPQISVQLTDSDGHRESQVEDADLQSHDDSIVSFVSEPASLKSPVINDIPRGAFTIIFSQENQHSNAPVLGFYGFV